MPVLTHELRPAPVAPRKGFWARVFDSIMEARMRRVEDALRIRGNLVAELRARHGCGITDTQSCDRK